MNKLRLCVAMVVVLALMLTVQTFSNTGSVSTKPTAESMSRARYSATEVMSDGMIRYYPLGYVAPKGALALAHKPVAVVKKLAWGKTAHIDETCYEAKSGDTKSGYYFRVPYETVLKATEPGDKKTRRLTFLTRGQGIVTGYRSTLARSIWDSPAKMRIPTLSSCLTVDNDDPGDSLT